MYPKYHKMVTAKAIGIYFDAVALAQIVKANLQQDALQNQLGNHPYFHFDDNKIAESLAYIDVEHNRIVKLIGTPNAGPLQRAAFGRLCHSVQDFYSHSNYVKLWVEAQHDLTMTTPEAINGLDDQILKHPALRTGQFVIWRDWIYSIPLIKNLVRRIYVPPNSHEAMHLDSPERGPLFVYSLMAAQQRTEHEYHRVERALREAGGQSVLEQFQRSEA